MTHRLEYSTKPKPPNRWQGPLAFLAVGVSLFYGMRVSYPYVAERVHQWIEDVVVKSETLHGQE